MTKVILYGTGRGADVAYRFLKRDSDFDICGFTLDSDYLTGDNFRGLPVVPFEDVERRFPPDGYQILVLLGYQGMNDLRRVKFEAAKAKGYRCISYVNSHFYRAETLNVGENCFILDNQSISLDVEIGNNVVMWSSNHVGDMTRIEDHAWVSSNVTIAAEAVIGSGTFLGIGCAVGNRVRLGAQTFVGAKVLLSGDTKDESVYLDGVASDPELSSRQFMRIMMARGHL